MTGYASVFERYHRLGWHVLPFDPATKWPPPKGYTGRDGKMPSYPDMLEWAEAKPDHNLGIRLPRSVIGIDVDDYEGKNGAATLAEAEKRWGKRPPTYYSTSRSYGVSGIRLYRIPEGIELKTNIEFAELGLGGIEICQFHHRYVIAWPSIHDKLGTLYRWYAELDGSVMDSPPALADIPELPPEWVEALTEIARNGAELGPDGAYDVSKAITEGDMSQDVAVKLGRALSEVFGQSRHDHICKRVLGLLRLGKNGEPGVKVALNALSEAFVNRVGKDRPGESDEARGEFKSFVYGDKVPELLADPDYDDEASETDNSDFIVTLVPASDIVSDIPDWVWEHEDLGRIQLGVLTLFAGRPGAGKSTAARWFAAQFSSGALDGCWKNKPQKIAYIASEESLEQVVKPGLQLAGANMDNIVFPKVTFNGEVIALMSDRDEAELTKQLEARGVTAIFVDPIMATIRRKVDIYRNNELRDALNPWVRIAQRIGGTVVGVVHLTKGTSGDVVAAVNGSSAFGEVARCVFGFAKDPQSDECERVMSQVKNACGVEDLSLTYEIDVKVFTADSGRNGLMPVLNITGDSDTTVSEILSTTGTKLRESMQQVLNFVNSRTETGAETVVDAGLAKSPNTAQNMLRRLYKRGYIDNPKHGHYCPKQTKPTE